MLIEWQGLKISRLRLSWSRRPMFSPFASTIRRAVTVSPVDVVTVCDIGAGR